ncbi:extracellular solute-binding protein [uncultured Vagococcus sp.]|uniref:extracellular solute-binding protein n=1 Tax=uncultured Vagococcus sp. TaxID=189676 RepID=UPI0028D41839|nr:extracellular solute-binding protein [uncultured Vagococcus sp.]
MRKNVKILVAASMLGLVLAGCGNKKEEAAKGGGKSNVIRIAYKDENSSNPNTKKYFDQLSQLMKEKENVDVEFEVIDLPSEGYGEKLNLQLASGDIPDLIYFQGGDTTVAEQGLLEDLTPYIKDSKYIKGIMEPQNTKRMENYPYLLWIKALSASVPVVKKDIFEQTKSGPALMADPSIANYEAFFKELVGKKGSDGKEVKYAVTTSGNTLELDNMFDMAFGNTQTWLKTADGYQYKRVSANEKEKITFYKKLYDEKLLDSQFITKKWDTKENAFYEGEAGLISGTSGKVIDMYNDKVEQLNETELVVLPPAKGEGQGYGAVDLSKENRGLAISSQSSNKELAFKVLDFLGSPEGQLLDRLGFEEEHYKIVDGKITITEEGSQWYAKFWEPRKLEVGKELTEPALSPVAEDSLDKVAEFYQEDNAFIIPDELVAKWDATENLYREYVADMITGKKDLSEFDQFVSEWEKSGGSEITEYANKTLK